MALEEKHRHSKLHTLFLDLSDQVKEGHLLSEALKAYPKVFDSIYLSLIKAGEESGDLKQSFQELAILINRAHSLKKKLSSAMIYPLFLGLFSLIVLSVLFFFLIPSMSELFEERSLHPMTEAVLALSRFLTQNAFPLLIGTSIFFLSLFLFQRHPTGKAMIKKGLLHLPIVSRVIKETILSRFCRVFSILLDGGVSMVESLRLAKEVMKHPCYEKVIQEAELKVLEGGSLSEQLNHSPLIPTLMVRILSIGEESGRISEMMLHLSNIYEEEVERSLSRLTSFIQPIMLLLLGLIVAVILLAVLLPLTDVSSILA